MFKIDQEFFSIENKHKFEQLKSIYIQLAEKEVLSVNFLKFVKLWNSFDEIYQIFKIKNLLGIDINLLEILGTNYSSNYYTFYFYNSRIDFYNRSKSLQRCHQQVFSSKKFQLKFIRFSLINNIFYSSTLCPYYFHKFKIKVFIIKYLSSTFFRKNLITFLKINDEEKVDIDTESISVEYCENIDLNADFVNAQFFKKTKNFVFLGKIRSIQSDLFTNLSSLSLIALDIYFARQLLQNTQIKWIEKLNYAPDRIIHINILQKFYQEYYYLFDINHVFPNEDFCLYKNFPFKKLILLSVFDYAPKDAHDAQYSCTFLWIAQDYSYFLNHSSRIANGQLFYSIFSDYFLLNKTNSSHCNFTRLLSNCQFASMPKSNKLDLYNFNKFTIMADYVTIIFLTPLLSILCFCLNLLGIYGLYKNSKLKELKNIQYKLIKIFSLLSLFYVVLKQVDMITECSFKNGLFCSSIVYSGLVQYYKIIFSDFFMRVIKTCINVSLIGYTAFRLNVLMSPGSRIRKLISDLSIEKMSFFTFIAFGFLCTPRLFIHKLNTDEPNLNYPSYLLDSYSSFIINKKSVSILIILNLISDLATNLLIIIANFVFDICLVLKLKADVKKMLPKNRSRANKKNMHQLIISFIMVFMSMILKSAEFFNSIYFLLGFLSLRKNHLMETRLEFFLKVVCLRYSFPTIVNHLLDLSFLFLNVLVYLAYFFGDKNFRNATLKRKKIFFFK